MPQKFVICTSPDAVMRVLIVFFFEIDVKAMQAREDCRNRPSNYPFGVLTALIVTSGAFEAQQPVLDAKHKKTGTIGDEFYGPSGFVVGLAGSSEVLRGDRVPCFKALRCSLARQRLWLY